jgi:DNA-binding XRE family transcriptional regulator
MALIVDFIVTANPPSLPAPGGTTVVTFQAQTDQGASQLEADYSLAPGVPYKLAGSTHMPPRAVSAIPQNFSQSLTLQRTGGGFVPFVQIDVEVSEVGSGETFPRSCNVTIAAPQAAAAGAVATTAAASPIGDRLRAFREANDLTQEDVAGQLGISRSHISRIERGGSHSDDVHRKLRELLKES